MQPRWSLHVSRFITTPSLVIAHLLFAHRHQLLKLLSRDHRLLGCRSLRCICISWTTRAKARATGFGRASRSNDGFAIPLEASAQSLGRLLFGPPPSVLRIRHNARHGHETERCLAHDLVERGPSARFGRLDPDPVAVLDAELARGFGVDEHLRDGVLLWIEGEPRNSEWKKPACRFPVLRTSGYFSADQAC